MQFSTLMTFHTAHTRFAEVDITWNSFILPEELIPNPAAMTGGAGARHRRGGFKYMPGEETSTDVFRLAYMAFPTGGMACGAVVSKHFLQLRMIFRHVSITSIDRGPISGLRTVQTVRIGSSLLFMALSTDKLWLSAWAGDHAFMRGIFVRNICASMTFNTGQLAMFGLREGLTID
jgi:hypothetical protein